MNGFRIRHLKTAVANDEPVNLGQFTELAQDAVGAMVDTSLVYVDGTPLLTRAALTGDVTAAQGSNTTTIANDAVSFAKMQNIATDSLVGRDTAGTGDPENILLNATLSMDGSGNLQRSALTGNVTAPAGSNTTTIAASVVTEAMQTLADNTTQNVTSTKHGYAPKSAGDATKFLNSDVTPAYAQVKDSDLAFTDITTNNVTSTKHGFVPKSSADATLFLNSAATPVFAAVKDSDLSTTDITTNDVSTSKHGFTPKLPNNAAKHLDGTGAYSFPQSSPGIITGCFYGAVSFQGGNGRPALITSNNLAANTIYYFPFLMPYSKTVTSLNLEVTAAIASSSFRLGLFNWDTSTELPTTLVVDGGAITTATTGNKQAIVSQALVAGTWYAFAVFNEKVNLQVQSYNGGPYYLLGNTTAASSNFNTCVSEGKTFGAMTNATSPAKGTFSSEIRWELGF